MLVPYDFAPAEIFGPYVVSLNPAVSTPASSVYDLFGPLTVRVTGIVYDTEGDWQRFSGQLRHASGVIRLAYRNTAEVMGLTNLLVNYRFGQRQDLVSDVGSLNGGTAITVGTGVLEITDDGVQSLASASGAPATTGNLGAVQIGGPSDAYTVIQSDSSPTPPGQVLATTFSFWTRFHPGQVNETVFGWDFKHWSGSGVQDQEWACHAYANAGDLHVDLLTQNGTSFSILGAADVTPWTMDGTPHHVAIYVYEYGTNQHRIMVFVDGLYAGGGENTGSAATQVGTNFASGGSGLYRPTILALAVAGQSNPGAAGWGSYSVTQPWTEAIDEFAISRGDLVMDINGHKYTSNPFAVGDRAYPPQSRHLSPSQVGYANSGFELVGPVEDSREANPTGVNRARALILGVPPIYDRGLSDADMSEVFFDRFYSFDNFLTPVDAINNEPVTPIDSLSLNHGRETLALTLFGDGAFRQDIVGSEYGSVTFWINRSAAGTNLALGGTASSSSSALGGVAGNAISGKSDLILSSTEIPLDQSFHSDIEDKPWWQVDVGQVSDIDSIILFARQNYSARLADFHVLVSSSPFPTGSLATVLATPGVWSYFHEGQVDFRGERVEIYRTGRYVRIWSTTTGWLDIAECRVFQNVMTVNPQDATIACFATEGPATDPRMTIILRTTGMVDVIFSDIGGTTRTLSTRTPLTSGWEHVCLTWGNSGTTLYFNGNVVDTYPDTMGADWSCLWVGEASTHAPSRLRASLDELGYSRQEFTKSQVQWFTKGGYFHDTPAGLPFGYHDIVQIATRANATSFASTDTTIPWSNWYNLAPGRAVPLGTRGSGRYVQCKVRMYPSDDDRAVTCPGLDRLELYLSDGEPKQDNSASFECKLRIGDYATFPCRMQVNLPAPESAGFPCRIKIVRPGIGGIFPGKFTVKSFARFPARMMVPVPAAFACRLNIGFPPGSKTFDCRVNITGKEKASAKFPAAAYVLQHGNAAFGLRVKINGHTWGCRASVYSRSSSVAACRLFVAIETPGAVPYIKSNIPARTWKAADEAIFWWGDASFRKVPVVRYFYSLATTPTATASLGWDSTPGTRVTLPVSSGKWYFTVAAQNAEGTMSPTATYEIWINKVPSIPGTGYMRINGLNTLADRPLVARHPATYHVLSWSPATDVDVVDGQAITYSIEIATRQDFYPDPRTGASSVVRTYENLPTNFQNWSDIPEPGIYFWRIRSSDGKQSSKWSSVGTFQVNAPPTRPGGLAAIQR